MEGACPLCKHEQKIKNHLFFLMFILQSYMKDDSAAMWPWERRLRLEL